MVYVLVIVVPFAIFMLYLAEHNRRLYKQYSQLVKQLRQVSKLSGAALTLDFHRYANDKIVTLEAVKALENCVQEIERQAGLPKTSFVSNKYAPKKIKMRFIAEKLNKITEAIGNAQAAVTAP